MTSLPVDHEARDRARTAVGESIALSAGAGSGKTSVLSARLVNVLASGVDPRRVAAITFTEKAAGELQRRVRDELERRLAAAEDPALRAQVDRFHELTLSTIHSFCLRILSLEPLASRWAPGTEVAEGDTRGLGRGSILWRRALAERDPLLLGLFDLRLARRSLVEGVYALLGNRDLEPVTSDAPLDWARAHEELVGVHGAVEEAAAACRAPKTDKLLANNAELRARLAHWASAPAGEATLVALVAPAKASRAGGKAADWPGGRDAFLAAVGGFEAWRAAWFTRAHGELVRSLRAHVVPSIEQARFERAVASFDDLLFRTAALLRVRDVRARLAERFDALLIDEVQDTDPIQAEVAALLARDPGIDGDWLEHPSRPGRLFAVGDPKQSIYRFRRADVTVWRDLSELISRRGHAGELTQNFRSVPGVVDWVGHVFADMPGFSPQVAWRGPATLDPVVVITSDQEAQIDHALRHLFDLRERGAKVVDQGSGELRPMRWDDVTILVPRWACAPAIATALGRAGVDSVVEGGGTFFEGEEVALALSALRAMDEPADTEAALHVLRGMFGFTLEELAGHVAAGGSFRYTVPEQPAGAVRDALEVLRDLRSSRVGSWVPPLDRLLDHTRCAAVWSMLADGHARLANLDKLRALIRQLEAQARSPSQVVSMLMEKTKDGEEELSRADPESDAVRITTIFKAKGLEAPVVVVLDAARSKPTPTVVAHRRERRVSIKIGADFEPPGWEATREEEILALNEERRRWMYVACTRARDQLVLVQHEKANLLEHVRAGWDPSELTHEARQELARGVHVRIRAGAELPQVVYGSETFAGRDAAVDALLAAPPLCGDPEAEAWEREAAAAVRRAARACLRGKSVGELVSKRRAPAAGTGLGALAGTVIHRAMQHLDLSREPGELEPEVPSLVSALARELGLDEETAERCVAVVVRLLSHPVLEEVRRAPEHWKETPFAFHERGRVVSGVIDLCFPVDESRRSWVVVDWKSDLPIEGHPLRAAYEKQLAFYARALLATVAPCELVRTILVGPHTELPARSDRDQVLAEVQPELRPGLERLLAAGAPVPQVGLDVGEPVVASVELAWEDEKVALGLDLLAEEVAASEAQGWALVAADTAEVGWARHALDALRAALGVGEDDEDADDSLSVDRAAVVEEAAE
ncbi:MAG: UvrD-helicase domain-containing protein [Sandaracinaceae bacterium]|nr:UvrD-helicase domain-containing protein [Sandaracinaceae bacterium]